MTTLCAADLNLHAADNVIASPFDDREKAKTAAGNAAFQRALKLGYSRIVAEALRRTAKREWFFGESADDCAVRIVRLTPGSSTDPKGAA